MQKLLAYLTPYKTWKHLVTKENFKADLMAAITGAIIVLPQGVAFATIAGMPPAYGLYTAMVPALIAAFFGSSWHLVSGPTTAASIMIFAFLSTIAEPASANYVTLALTLTFMVGLTQVIMGIARLGTLVNFISHSVVVGFTAGAGILIAFKQFKNFFGLSIPRGSAFYEIIQYFFTHLAEINWYVAAVGITTLLSGYIFKRWIKKVPYMIASMLIGSVVGVLINKIYGGVEVTGITTVGALTAAIPPLSMPDFSLKTFQTLAPAVLATTLLALTEAVAIARSIAVKSGQKLDGNQEFVGQGLSNMIGSFFSAYVATGSFNRSGVNYEAGAKTPLAAAMAGVILIGVLLLVAPWAAYLPTAAMAGILMLVAFGIIDFHSMKVIQKTSKGEAGVLWVTFFATLFLHLEFAILAGVIFSFLFYLSKTSRPSIYPRVVNPSDSRRKFTTFDDPEVQDQNECPQMKFIRVDGSLFFGSVGFVEEKVDKLLAEHPHQKHFGLMAQGVNFVDVAGAEFLVQLAKKLKEKDGSLSLYKVKDKVRNPLEQGEHIDHMPEVKFYDSKGEMIKELILKMDPEICRTCTRRVYNECKGLAGT